MPETALVIHADDVPAVAEHGATVRVPMGRSWGSGLFEEAVVDVTGRCGPWRHDDAEAILFAVSGTGTLHLDGAAHPLEHETSAYGAPGRPYELEAGDGGLRVVRVLVGLTAAGFRDPGAPVTIRYEETERVTHPTVVERAYRVLVETPAATQFVGYVPTGRAKPHFHRYEEVAYILSGEGVLHMDGHEPGPFRPGSCVHFPPSVPHTVENAGAEVVRVLGVFHPAGSPAEAYDPATGEPAS